MPVQWKVLEDSLRQRNPTQCFSSNEIEKFRGYVASVPAGKRVPLLLEAYAVYRGERHGTPRRGCDALVGDKRQFEKSVASVLISVLLKSRLKPNEQETCDILRNASHYCGHGSDVLPPVNFIEIAVQGKPFTAEIWVIWHDVSKPDAECYTGAIQRAIAKMNREEAFAWQWLLRKTVAGFRPGTTWHVEAGKRLEALGRDKFLETVGHLDCHTETENGPHRCRSQCAAALGVPSNTVSCRGGSSYPETIDPHSVEGPHASVAGV